MAYEIKSDQSTRRYVRLAGPFDGYDVGPPITPVLVYNLNLGGGFVNFPGEQPTEVSFVFKIMLPNEGGITVHAETVYRNDLGVAGVSEIKANRTVARLVQVFADSRI